MTLLRAISVLRISFEYYTMYLKPTSLVAMEVVRMNNNNLYFRITQSGGEGGISCLCTGMYDYHCSWEKKKKSVQSKF